MLWKYGAARIITSHLSRIDRLFKRAFSKLGYCKELFFIEILLKLWDEITDSNSTTALDCLSDDLLPLLRTMVTLRKRGLSAVPESIVFCSFGLT